MGMQPEAAAPMGYHRPGIPQKWSVLAIATLTLMPGCPRGPGTATGERVALQLIADGFTSPVGLAQPDDGSGRLFVVDLIGVIRIIDTDGELLDEPFLDVRDRMIELSPTYDERGLLGLAFHPDFSENGRFFVVYNGPTVVPEYDSELILAEFRVSDDDANAADPDSELVVLSISKPQYNHNGGQIAFGPDGMLYLSVGDGGGGNDEGPGHNPEIGNGQDLSTLLGKILRIDVDADSEDPYTVPADNPFVGQEGAREEIWAYGLRNPWRFSFDPGGDRRLFVADAGQDLFEEVDIIVKGGNYGWRIREGTSCFNVDEPGEPLADCPDTGSDGQPLIDPILELEHTSPAGIPIGTVIIGGYVYRGADVPSLTGDYIFGDFTTLGAFPDGQLYAASESDDGTWTRRRLLVAGSVSGTLGAYVLAFGQDLAGEVYVLVTGSFGPVGTTGQVFRIEAPQ